MPEVQRDIVTGVGGYTGRHIARLLLDRGRHVRSLTAHPERAQPLDPRVEVCPFNFAQPDVLAESLAGADTLYNTYWVRFERGATTFARAIENTKTLVRAAEAAGLRRIVHISIANPSANSALPYFRGKGVLEEFIAASTLSYALVRPTVLFGGRDILINNIAWFLRRIPIFAVPGKGDYRLQPVCVEDLAQIAVSAGGSAANIVVDAVGPEIFRFDEFVRLIGRVVGSRARIVHVPADLALVAARAAGWAVSDVVLTRDEIAGLMANLLISERPPTAPTRFSDWLLQNKDSIGRTYASELVRHYRSNVGPG